MAVYYKWIKGCASNASLDSGLWTYLKWGSGTAGTSVSNLPHIYTYTGKQDNPETENDLGYILTNNITGVNINSSWIFNKSIKMNNSSQSTSLDIAPHNDFYKITTTNDFCVLTGGNIALGVNLISSFNYRCIHIVPSSKKDSFDGARTNILSDLYIGGDTTNNNHIAYFPRSGTSIIKSPLEIQNYLKVTNYIHSDSYCEASYFNATSDIRAKENIKPATYNALELINKLSIYTYNYKNQNERLTGIMAQDLLKNQPKELDLVSNINATGVNNDYMSIKNDKLMFVLMKAIQEQQKEIEELKSKIEVLEKK